MKVIVMLMMLTMVVVMEMIPGEGHAAASAACLLRSEIFYVQRRVSLRIAEPKFIRLAVVAGLFAATQLELGELTAAGGANPS